jgi:hypothetical protein
VKIYIGGTMTKKVAKRAVNEKCSKPKLRKILQRGDMSPLNPPADRSVDMMRMDIAKFMTDKKSNEAGKVIKMLQPILKKLDYKFMIQLRKPIQRNFAILAPEAKPKVYL